VPPAQKIISLCALRASAAKKYYSEYVTVIPNLCTKQNGSLLRFELNPTGISNPVEFKNLHSKVELEDWLDAADLPL